MECIASYKIKINAICFQGLEYHSLSKENKNVVKLPDKAPAPQGKCSCRTR